MNDDIRSDEIKINMYFTSRVLEKGGRVASLYFSFLYRKNYAWKKEESFFMVLLRGIDRLHVIQLSSNLPCVCGKANRF